MYTTLDKAELLTFEQIREKYDGKWVFMTNCEFSPGNMLVRGIPRIVADKELENLDDGIYDVYNNKELYGETYDYSFNHEGIYRDENGILCFRMISVYSE